MINIITNFTSYIKNPFLSCLIQNLFTAFIKLLFLKFYITMFFELQYILPNEQSLCLIILLNKEIVL